jgi:hypothetical protein
MIDAKMAGAWPTELLVTPTTTETEPAADISVDSSAMRFPHIILVAILIGAAGLLTGRDAADAGAASKVLALELAWNQAEERKDTKALDALFDNALIYVDYDGSLRTKAEFLARVKSSTSQPQQETTESMNTRIFGATVVVTGIYLAKGIENGKPYVRHGRFLDTWVLRDGKWLCVASQSTPIPR